MKITKYEHACLVAEEQGKKLVIDPGSFVRTKFDDVKDVVGIVITHVHGDHLSGDHIADILKNNPQAQLFGTQEVASELKDRKINVVTGGDTAIVGPFELKFFGGQHAVIHPSWPVNQNVGVMVNSQLYYPGDSFSEPGEAVHILGLPVSAPWLKIAETMDFLTKLKPKIAFPTHNAILSDTGENLVENMLDNVATAAGTKLQSLKPGESLEI